MKVILDTNAYSQLKQGHKGVAEAVRTSDEVLFSAIVAGELLHGFRRGTRYRQNLAELEDFLNEPPVTLLPVTFDTADRFARVAADLASRGTPIPTNDIWIAAHAFEHGAELITFDAHFARVPGLAYYTPPSQVVSRHAAT